MGEDFYEMDSSQEHFVIGDRLIANQDRDSLQLGRNICPNPPQLKPSYDKGMLMETDERLERPVIGGFTTPRMT